MSARDDSWWQQADIEAQEHEAIEALNAVAAAGLTEEAGILASAAGLLSRWKKRDKPKRQAAAINRWP